MRIKNKLLAAVLFGLTALVAFTVQAQSSDNARFLSLSPPEGLPIIPVMEGWVANLDGTTSISFGIINRNDEATDIPLGENNFIEPAKYDGIQLTHFPAGRTVGAFAVTIPESEADIDVVWSIKTGDSDPLTVPGRRGASAYELDFILPRPQGALQPLVGIGEDGPQTAPAVGLITIIEDYPRNPVGVGQQVLLTINATDPAVRDPEDPRFEEALAMGVSFTKLQGPGDVEFTMHPDNETEQENPYAEDDPRSRFFRPPGPNELEIAGPAGIGQVYASFSEPGEYIIWTKVDVHKAPDSSNGDQCCWTNVYQRISVQ